MLDEQAITLAALARPSLRHRVRRMVLSLVALLLLAAVGTGAAMTFVNHPERSRIKHAALLPNPDNMFPGETVPTREPAAGDAQNILLIGSDSSGSPARAVPGVIVLMHVSSDRRQVHLVHFPGSMYVDVPGHGQDRIDAAYGFGGPQLLVRTVQQLLDVPVDHAVVIGYDGLRDMTDVVGGVDVTAEGAGSARGDSTSRQGVNRLDGAAALGFVREQRRPGESDISLGLRQLAFIKALLLRSLTTNALANPIQLAQLMDVAAHNLTVDNAFSVAEMRALTADLKHLDSNDFVSITAPITGLGKDPRGASFELVNSTGMAQLTIALKRDEMAGFPLG